MVRIITDSSSLYTVEEGKAAGIEAIPLCITIGGCQERDLQVNMEEFYQKIEDGQIPMSSQPPIGEVLEAFERFQGEPVINISMADGLSGTYQSACAAKGMAKNQADITVFNSKTLCGPHNYLVTKAQMMAVEGLDTKRILAWLEAAAEKTESFLIPQDFSFLKRGGRLTPVAAAIGSMLKLKPILQLTKDGTRLDKFGIKRTMSSAVESLIKNLQKKQLGAQHLLYIAHGNVPKDAAYVKELFQKAYPELEIIILELSAAFVTQGGPRCLAIQYIER